MSTTPHDPDLEREIERTRSEAAHLASGAAESAKERGRETLDQAKERAADRADEVASALESTAADLDSSDDTMAGYGRSMAELMRRFAGGLREHEIEEFAGELAGFARRNPASFFAGSVALGFGLSRFLKATSVRPVDDGYDDDFEDEEAWLEGEEGELDEELYAGETGTFEAESSPGAGTERWPEDTGPARPGAGSSTDHWTPAAAPESPSAGPELAAPGSGETRAESIDPRDPESRRNEP